MIREATVIFKNNLEAYTTRGKRRALNEGGTSSSKTYSILQLLISIAQSSKEKMIISVVSESLPHLKRGCIRDFMNIMGDDFEDSRWNKTDSIYNFDNVIWEHFPADDPSKQRGGRREILFINEANNVAYEAFRNLDKRTKLFTFLDWNPVSEFWAHEKDRNGESMIDYPENVYIHSTYLDAIKVVPKDTIDNIESEKERDPNWWNVYGLGLLGKIEGLVYPEWMEHEQLDKLPEGKIFFGLDWGYTDPTVLVGNVIIDDCLYSKEYIYESKLTNGELSLKMIDAGVKQQYDEIIADSEDPKSIEEMYRLGWNIKPCIKIKGSVEFGHKRVRHFNQYWTKDSLNCIKEQRNFMYITDRHGRITENTTHKWKHGMDARRYAVTTHISSQYGISHIPVVQSGVDGDIGQNVITVI